MSIFERYGDVYRLLIDEEKRWAHEGALLTRLAGEAGTGQGRVLDLACGTGFHARHLAAAGNRVVAVDVAESMLRTAVELTPPGLDLEYRHADILRPVAGTYDLALLLGNTYSALPDQPAVFAAAAAALVPRGELLLHIIDYETLRREGLRHTVKRGPVGERDTVVSKVMTPLEDGMLVAFTVQQERDGAWTCAAEQTRLQQPDEAALLAAAEAAGFDLVERWSGLDGAAWQPGTGRDRVFRFRQTGA